MEIKRFYKYYRMACNMCYIIYNILQFVGTTNVSSNAWRKEHKLWCTIRFVYTFSMPILQPSDVIWTQTQPAITLNTFYTTSLNVMENKKERRV